MTIPPPAPKPQPAPPHPLRGGVGARLAETPWGRILSVNPGSSWRHPWQTRLTWLENARQWVASVAPGFVNGHCPVVTTSQIEDQVQIEGGYDFGINPVTGEPFSQVYIFNLKKTLIPGTDVWPIRVPLYANPAIPLTWQNVGWDGPGSSVPSFFKNRGVASAPAISVGGPVNTADMAPPKGTRLLRAAKLVLHQPRTALTSSITTENGLTGDRNVVQTLSLRSPSANDYLKVFCGEPVNLDVAGIDPLAGDYEEPTYDEILICTCYLLSPPDIGADSEPDGSWQPFVKHELFWNLSYAQPVFEITNADLENAFASLTSVTNTLGGGTAAIAVNFLASGLNDLFANALNMITAKSMAGTFWTPTAGGHTSAFPADDKSVGSVGSDGSGLNRTSALQAQRLAAQRAALAEKLDPSFPFEARPFPISFLS